MLRQIKKRLLLADDQPAEREEFRLRNGIDHVLEVMRLHVRQTTVQGEGMTVLAECLIKNEQNVCAPHKRLTLNVMIMFMNILFPPFFRKCWLTGRSFVRVPGRTHFRFGTPIKAII